MLFTFIVVALFVFFAPAFAFLSFPICVAYLIVKSKRKKGIKKDYPKENYPDEFDIWQDNQGL